MLSFDLEQLKTSKRILIIGICGSGKSTLSRLLGEKLNLQLVHLDKIFWNPGWIQTEKDRFLQIVKEHIEQESWIMDGNFNSTLSLRLERADYVIYLDLSPWTAFFRVLKRFVFSSRSCRSDMADGCKERLSLSFYKYILFDFPRTVKPRNENILSQYQELPLLRIKSRKEQQAFLDAVHQIKTMKV